MGDYCYPVKLADFFQYVHDDGRKILEKALVLDNDDAEEDALYESFLGLVYRVGYGGHFPFYSSGVRWHGAVDVSFQQKVLTEKTTAETPAGKLMCRSIGDGVVIGSSVDRTYSGPGNGGVLLVVRYEAPDGRDFYARYVHMHNTLTLTQEARDALAPWPKTGTDADRVAWTAKLRSEKLRLPHLRSGSKLTTGQELGPMGWMVLGHHLHFEILSEHDFDLGESVGFSVALDLKQKANHYVMVSGLDTGDSYFAGLPKKGKKGKGWYSYHPIHFIHKVLRKGEELNLNPRRVKFTGKSENKPKPKPHTEGGDVEIAKIIKAPVLDVTQIHKVSANRSFTKSDLHSAAITAIQQALHDLGYSLGSSGPKKNGIDGDYGNKTTSAVMKFQKDHKDQIKPFLTAAKLLAPSLPDEPRVDGEIDWPTLVALSFAWTANGGGAKTAPSKPKKAVVLSEPPDDAGDSPPPDKKSDAPADDGEWRYPHPAFERDKVRKAPPRRTKKHRLEGGVDYKGVLWPKLDPKSTEPKVLIAIPTVHVEGGRFDSVNMYDRAIFTWGFSQWTCHAGSLQDVLRFMKGKDEKVFEQVFVKQGVDVPLKKKSSLAMIIDGKTVDTKQEMRVVFKGTDVDRTPSKDAPVGEAQSPDWSDDERKAMIRWCEVFVSASHHKRVQELQQEYAIENEIPRCFGKNFDGWVPVTDKSSKYYKYKDRFAAKGYGKISKYLNGNLYAQALLFSMWVNNRVMAYKILADAIDEGGDLGEAYYKKLTSGGDTPDSWKLAKDGRAAKTKSKFDETLAGRKIAGLSL